MNNENEMKIFLVDNNTIFLKSLETDFIQHSNLVVEKFTTGELCIKNLVAKPEVVILDYHLGCIDKNEMNGMETLDKIKYFDPDIPVVMLFSQNKIVASAECLNNWDFSYVIKNKTVFIRLQKIITSIFKTKKLERELNWYMDRM